ncbi:MAG TPA: MXAN_5187 C-terminal domain-containing protein [Vicinamibacterales bacterium]
MPEHTELERDLRALEVALRKLETEYNMFFAGQLPKPPWGTRHRVEAILHRFDRAFIQSATDRFRLSTLQSRFSTFADLWDRGLRAREEGRPGPFYKAPREAPPVEPSPQPPADRVVGSATVSDLAHDEDKVEALYESLIEARKAVGADEPFPFHRFAQIVQGQVTRLQKAGSREVAFRISVKEGKVAFTARGVKTSGGTPVE